MRNCNHIRPRCVVYRRYNRARGPRALANGPSKAGLRRFSGCRQSFFKSHPPAKSGPVIGRRDSGCYHCDSAVFPLSLSLFFFVLLPLFLSISLSLSCFPVPLSLYHESVSANRVKNDYARFMRSFVRRFVPRDLWATSMNDLRLCSTLGQLRLKNIGWLSLCDSLPGNGDIKFLGYLTFKSLDLRVS